MKNLTNRNGVAAVEAAVCLPILAFVVFAAVELSGGIFQEYNAQATAYELSKVALRAQSTCTDVQDLAADLLPDQDFATYSIEIETVARSVNQNSVETPAITSFSIPQSGSAPVGLEDIPRGTLLRLTLSADRPAIAGRGFFKFILTDQINADCVFVKEF